MSARSILIAIALSAWLLASVVAFFIVADMSFFGVAFIGLVICYVSAQFELDGDRPVGKQSRDQLPRRATQGAARPLRGATPVGSP